MNDFCFSCSAPLSNPELRCASDKYCVFCCDDEGKLKSRSDVLAGITAWIQGWQGIDEETATERAALLMRAMPAWADN